MFNQFPGGGTVNINNMQVYHNYGNTPQFNGHPQLQVPALNPLNQIPVLPYEQESVLLLGQAEEVTEAVVVDDDLFLDFGFFKLGIDENSNFDQCIVKKSFLQDKNYLADFQKHLHDNPEIVNPETGAPGIEVVYDDAYVTTVNDTLLKVVIGGNDPESGGEVPMWQRENIAAFIIAKLIANNNIDPSCGGMTYIQLIREVYKPENMGIANPFHSEVYDQVYIAASKTNIYKLDFKDFFYK